VRAEISIQLHNDEKSPTSPVNADYRYSLGRGEHWLYVYAVLDHKPGYPPFSVGEARYCLKLNPTVFDYLTVDANRHRIMPSGSDWDHGGALNMKEARRMTTGVHKGEPEHKYDYSAVFSETPAYGWSSTKQNAGLWMINPSLEYLGGGPTKAELTGHLDVNPGGLPTLLNMWVGSHYGGTTLSVAQNESWTKVVGPFVLYCNSVSTDSQSEAAQSQLWQDAVAHAEKESSLWPYEWVSDANYPSASNRGLVRGEIVFRDPLAPDLKLSNLWVGVTAPDYVPPARFGFGFRGALANSATNASGRGFGFGRGGLPPYVDWQRDAKFYQFWTRADAQGRFSIPNVRAGTYTLHAFGDGVLGEFTLTNISVAIGEQKSLGQLKWTPPRFGRTVWQIGVPDRIGRHVGDRDPVRDRHSRKECRVLAGAAHPLRLVRFVDPQADFVLLPRL
jgi:rhamnogalacturonan endolyase